MSTGDKMTKLGKLQLEWDIYTLDEIKRNGTSISYGVVQPGPEDPKGVLFIRGGDVKNGKIGSNLRTISQKVSNQYTRTILKGGELLVSLVGYPGECAIVPEHLIGANIARQVGIIRIKEGINPYYVQQYLSSPIGKKNLLGNLVGSAQQVINLEMLRKVEIPLPTLIEQKKIAEILSTVDEKIEVIVAQITQTQALKKGLMQQLLTRGIGHTQFKASSLGEIPESWSVETLESVTIPKVGLKRGPFGGALKKELFIESGYKVYEQRNAIYKDLSIGNYYIDDLKFKEMEGFAVKHNDFIVSCSGTIGKIAEITEGAETGVINQALLRIRVNQKVIDRYFFLHLFESESIQNKIIDATQGGAMKNLVGMSEFRKTSFALPPLPEQKKIATALNTIDQKIEVLNRKKTAVQLLKKGLMQQLLTGRIRVNQTNYTHDTAKPRGVPTATEC